MSRLTVGDCVTVLGKPWAREQGISAAGNLEITAPEEWAQLARQTISLEKSLVVWKKKKSALGKGRIKERS